MWETKIKLHDIRLDQVPSESGTSFMPLEDGEWAMRTFGDAKGGATAALLPDRQILSGSRLKGAGDRA